MLRRIKTLLLGLAGLFLLDGFQCEKPEGLGSIPFRVQNWRAEWLDNRGTEPVIAGNTILRTALGFRLSADLILLGPDSLTTIDPGQVLLYLEKPIQKIQFFSSTAFDGLAAGTNISDRFQLRVDFRDGQDLHYPPVDFSLRLLNEPPVGWGVDYHADFLMTSPPGQTGPFECAVKITYDSTTTPPVDTFFTLPTIMLQ